MTQDDRIRAARAHLKSVEEIADLNATVFGNDRHPKCTTKSRSPISSETRTFPTEQRIIIEASNQTDVIERQLNEVRAQCEAKITQLNRRAELAEKNAHYSLSDLERRLTQNSAQSEALINELMRRMAVLEAERDENRRCAARCIATTDELRGKMHIFEHSDHLGRFQSELHRFKVSTETKFAAFESKFPAADISRAAALDEISASIDRSVVATDQVATRCDSFCARLTRVEEQLAQARRHLDDTSATVKLDKAESDACTLSQRDQLTSLDQRHSSLQALADERHSELSLKVDTIQTDLSFAREQLARCEERLNILQHNADTQSAVALSNPVTPNPLGFAAGGAATDTVMTTCVEDPAPAYTEDDEDDGLLLPEEDDRLHDDLPSLQESDDVLAQTIKPGQARLSD